MKLVYKVGGRSNNGYEIYLMGILKLKLDFLTIDAHHSLCRVLILKDWRWNDVLISGKFHLDRSEEAVQELLNLMIMLNDGDQP